MLRLGSLGLLGLTLPQMMQSALAAGPGSAFGRAKRCILLFMWGGPSQLETWDLKPDAPEEVRGEFRPISTKVSDIQIGEHFPRLAQRTDKLCLVRSMTHSNPDHTRSTSFLLTGQPPLEPGADVRRMWPNIGSVLAAMGRGNRALPALVQMRPKVPGDVPRFVEESQGQFAGWLGAAHDPLTIDDNPNLASYHIPNMELSPDLTVARLDDRMQLMASLDRQRANSAGLSAKDDSHRKAFELLSSAASGRGAFNLDEESPALRDRYGRNPHGQSVLQARRLIERGVPLVTVFWPNEGIKNVSVYWDTHNRNFVDLKDRLMPVTDLAFSALLDDLQERGLFDDTIVVWTGEFGRTPRVAQSVVGGAGAGRDGRDHWPGCFTTVLAGGPFKRGFVYGRSDKHAAFPASDPVAPSDLVATIYHALGVPPRQTLTDITGRPQFVRPGTAIEGLFA